LPVLSALGGGGRELCALLGSGGLGMPFGVSLPSFIGLISAQKGLKVYKSGKSRKEKINKKRE
jgi:hypothetical protein